MNDEYREVFVRELIFKLAIVIVVWGALFTEPPMPVIAAEKEANKPNPNVYSKAERSHWSFQSSVSRPVPTLNAGLQRDWIKTPVDVFVLNRLQKEKLQPATETDRQTLIRRIYFDLIGIPPTPKEVHAFVSDQSLLAYVRLVDRLLADPRYGERWGQHWLDVVRFAESEGFEYDRHRPTAWQYRDYVIQSFRDDKPYNQFVSEQLAGDEMPVANSGEAMTIKERDARIAAGFHRLGPVRRNAGNADVAFSRNEVLTEMTDAVGSTFLGLTIGCARCHDHMFDPIRQKDYYRLQAFLGATHVNDVQLGKTQAWKKWTQETARINAEITAIKKRIAKSTGAEEKRLRQELKETQASLPLAPPSLFSVKNIPEKRTVVHFLKRGDEFQKLEKVGMRVPGVFLPDQFPELPQHADRPKTRLANWIAHPSNPLTARVMVNRIWQYHFGAGLVATSNDFGLNGAEPSHPELLDWLATEFVRRVWSVKSIHRLILLSSTYRQSSLSAAPSHGNRVDPDSRLLWRFPRRRLDAEQIRDAMLSIAGVINQKSYGPSIFIPVDPELVALLYKPSQWKVTKNPREHNRRSVYLFAKRNLRLPFLEVFDQPTLQTSCFRREASTHAPQSLELLNGKFSNRLAKAFAVKLKKEAGNNSANQITLGFQLIAGRIPTSAERRLSLQFLHTQPLDEFCLALFNLNSFLYID